MEHLFLVAVLRRHRAVPPSAWNNCDADFHSSESMESKQVFRRQGDYWTIMFDGDVIRLRDTKGLRYLAALLRRPGRQIAATDVVMCANTPHIDAGSRTGPSEKAELDRR